MSFDPCHIAGNLARKAEENWFSKYRAFGIKFDTFQSLRESFTRGVNILENPSEDIVGEESPLLKLFQMSDFIDIFFGRGGNLAKHEKGFADYGAKYDVLANERLGKGALFNRTDVTLLACASEKIRLKLSANEESKIFTAPILYPFDMRNLFVVCRAWSLFKNSTLMKNATERNKFKATYDFCNALDRNPYNPKLLTLLVDLDNIDYVPRAQRIRLQDSRNDVMNAMMGDNARSTMYIPSYTFNEQGYSDSEEEETARQEWEKLDAEIPVMGQEMWDTLPQDIKDQGMAAMNAYNEMKMIDDLAWEMSQAVTAETEAKRTKTEAKRTKTPAAAAAKKTTEKQDAKKDAQPKEKAANPFRGMFDRNRT
jgi:hypothetical protein